MKPMDPALRSAALRQLPADVRRSLNRIYQAAAAGSDFELKRAVDDAFTFVARQVLEVNEAEERAL